MKRSNRFTLIELLVIVAVMAILVSLLLPALGRARYRAKTMQCMANLRQLGMGFFLYAGDHDTYYPVDPVASNLANLLPDGSTFRWDQKTQTINNYKDVQGYWEGFAKNVFLCPHAEEGVREKYGANWPYRQTNAHVQCYFLPAGNGHHCRCGTRMFVRASPARLLVAYHRSLHDGVSSGQERKPQERLYRSSTVCLPRALLRRTSFW